MPKLQELRIKKGNEYLAHEGHAHYWTKDRDAAMIYTKPEVAQALADLRGGAVITVST